MAQNALQRVVRNEVVAREPHHVVSGLDLLFDHGAHEDVVVHQLRVHGDGHLLKRLLDRRIRLRRVVHLRDRLLARQEAADFLHFSEKE